VLHILNEIKARHFGIHLILLIVLVFVAIPILKSLLFRRARQGGLYLPPRKAGWSPAQVREARRYLMEQRRRPAEKPSDDGS
jgi:hypothetical protein